MADLLREVERLQTWAAAIPPARRHGEWECDYEFWDDLYKVVIRFVDTCSFTSWSPEEVGAIIFAVARDSESEHLAEEIRTRNSQTLVGLARASITGEEHNAKWQFAEQLGHLGQVSGESEALLLTLAGDADEYVRRRSLQALARLGSRSVEDIALAEWKRPGDCQQWSRMNVLWCLHRVSSPQLGSLLDAAERDERKYLSDFAIKIRRGDIAL